MRGSDRTVGRPRGPVDPRVPVVAVGASGGRVRCVVVVRLRWLGASVSARAAIKHILHHYDPRPFDGAHHDASPFDSPRDYRGADCVTDLLSISLTLTVSFGLTGSIEER